MQVVAVEQVKMEVEQVVQVAVEQVHQQLQLQQVLLIQAAVEVEHILQHPQVLHQQVQQADQES